MPKTRKPYRFWRQSDIKLMRTLAGKNPRRKIARQLHRSEGAVAQKAFEIGLSLRYRHG